MPVSNQCIVSISTFPFEFTNVRYAGMEISDNGPGFPADVLGRAFDPYMTTKPKGNGLGLAIVKKIIEEHNGVIRAANKREGGATINIRFPLYDYGVKKAPTKMKTN